MFPFQILQTFSRQASNVNYITMSEPWPAGKKGTLEGVTNSFGMDLNPPGQNLQSWNVTVESQLGRESAIEIAYVGSKGTHLGRKYNINQPLRRPGLQLPGGGFPKPYSAFGTINYYSFGSNSVYNAGILTLHRRAGGGLFYRLSYIYSKSIDDASQISGAGDGGVTNVQDARDLKLERGRSDFDIGHSLMMSFNYNLPWRRWKMTRGWQLSGTGRMYTGQPFTPKTSDVDLDAGESNRPDRLAKGWLEERSPQRWFDLPAFRVVPTGSYRLGTSGRNILDGPGHVTINLAVARRFQLEKGSVQLRAEALNALNRTNLKLPNENVNAVNGGRITGANAARIIQLALRWQF